MVEGGVDGNERLIEGLRDDFSFMLTVFVDTVAGSEPGSGAVDKSFCLGGRGCCGCGSLGSANCQQKAID